MNRSLSLRAIDHAFILHVSNLFEKFCADIKMERDRNPANSHARKQFEADFTFARTTRQEMMQHIETILEDRP